MCNYLKSFLFISFCIILLTGCGEQNNSKSIASQSTITTQNITLPPFVEHPDTAKIEYPDTTIYYDDGKYIYAYNPRTQEKKQLTIGMNIHLSHKQDRFVYGFYTNHLELVTSSKTIGFYTYDLKTGESKLLYQLEEDEPTSVKEWSKDDKYIILIAGGDVEVGYLIFDGQTNQPVVQFGTHEHSIEWLNDHEIIFTDLEQYPRPYMGSALGIAIINLLTKEKRIIKHATETENYYFLQTSNNKIIFSKTIFSTVNSNEFDNSKTTYWTMNIDGSNPEEIQEYKKSEYINTKLSEESKQIQVSLPEMHYNYFIMPSSIIDKGNWTIFMLQPNSYAYQELFIMDKTNPHSLRKIGEGHSIVW